MVDNSGRQSSTRDRVLAQHGTCNIELTCCFLQTMCTQQTKPTTIETSTSVQKIKKVLLNTFVTN